MNPVFFYEMGRRRMDMNPIVLNFYETNSLTFDIATKTKSIDIEDSSGTIHNYLNINPTKNYALDTISSGIILNFAAVRTSEAIKIKPKGGREDIVSIRFSTQVSNNGNNDVIPNWLDFLKQFPKLESFNFFYARQTTLINLPKITGNLIAVPRSVKYVFYERIYVFDLSLFYIDFNTINADNELKYFRHDLQLSNVPKVVGNLFNIPSTLQYFKIVNFGTGTSVNYTGSGKVFNSTLDTFYFNRTLTTANLDQLLIDLNNSVTTAIGDKIIYLRGTRSATSDSAVAGLISKGFTVTITA